MAKAGFQALLASISIHRWNIVGAQKLRDAGFMPSGKNLSLIVIGPDNGCHLAEMRLDALLEEHHIEDAEKVEVKTDCKTWNLRMTFWTAVLSIIGSVPYIHLSLSRNTLPLSTRLGFPLIHVLGGFLAATSSQILIQYRLISILKHQLSFRVFDSVVKSALQDPEWWNFKIPSEVCLWKLQNHLKNRSAIQPRQRLQSALRTRVDAVQRWMNTKVSCHQDVEKTPAARDLIDAGKKDALVEVKYKLNKMLVSSKVL